MEFLERYGPLRDRGWSERSDGLLLPPSVELPKAPPTAMDLFAGAGGFSCGLHMAGLHVVAASEWWPVAVATYLCNLGSPDTVVHVGTHAALDATKKEQALFAEYGGQAVPAGVIFPVREEPIPAGHSTKTRPGETRVLGPGTGWISKRARHQPDDHACASHLKDPAERQWFHDSYCLGGQDFAALPCEHLWMCDAYDLRGADVLEALGMEVGELGLVVGGPPCQGFSRANVNASKDDPRNLLVFEFARLVLELKPQAMAMENVPAIASMTTAEGIPILDALATVLENGDFGTYEALRKSLRATAGVGAAVRGKRAKPVDPGIDESDDELDGQLALEVEAVPA